MDILMSKDYSFVDYQGNICVKTNEGLYNFIEFVKSKCNCK